MKHTLFIFVACALCTVLCGTSCTHVTLSHTDHPEEALLLVSPDFTERTQGIAAPSQYTVQVQGNAAVSLQGATAQYPHLLAPGQYRLQVYNPAEGIIMQGNVATVQRMATDARYLQVAPGWLFTAQAMVEVQADTEYQLQIPMQQQVRQLVLLLHPDASLSNKLQGIEGVLNGVASAWDYITNSPIGEPDSVAPSFVKQPDGSWKATLHLIGVQGSVQDLASHLTVDGAGTSPIVVTSHPGASLADFNTLLAAKNPLVLEANISITEAPNPGQPAKPNYVATITDWVEVEEGAEVVK